MHTLSLLAVLTLSGLSDKPTFEFDVVEVFSGRATPGKDSITADHGRFVYWFASEKNREAFRRNPERYEIQLGGACARMGPLSGSCRNDIYAVHDGKLYLFASKQCREGFLKAPDKLLERDETIPTPDASAQRKGGELLERAARAIDPVAALAQVKSYRETVARDPADKSETMAALAVWTWRFPDSFRVDEAWGKSKYAMYVGGNAGGFIQPNGSWEMVAAQSDALRRQAARHPLAILVSRDKPGFTCSAAGRGRLAGTDVELVTVNFDGATTTLGIDAESDNVIAIRCRERGGPRGTVGEIEKRYSDFRDAGGLMLPHAVRTVAFDGEPFGEVKPTTITKIEVNPSIDDALFQAPR